MPFPASIVEYARVNGRALSRTSISLRIGTLQAPGALLVVGWTDLSFKNPRTPGKSYGSKANPQARTRGKVAPTGSITVYELEWNAIRTFLAAQGRPTRGWSEVETIITLTYNEPSISSGVQIVGLENTCFLDAEQTVGDDDGELKRVCPLDIMRVSENGVYSVVENGIPGF